MQTRRPPQPLDTSPTTVTLAAAFDTVEHEILAVPDDQLVRMCVNVPRATQVAFGAAERIDALLPMLEQLSFFDPAPARKLRTYAAAALHAHLVAKTTDSVQDDRLPRMLEEGRELRANLMIGAESLAHFGLVPAQRVAAIRAGTGNLDMATDLSALSTLLGEAWTEVKDKVPFTRAMVSRAGELGLELQIALGIRRIQRAALTRSEARMIRARAFTLFVRAYDACRRGVTFLRWGEGDIDWYVPTIYVKRSRRAPARARPILSDRSPKASTASEAEAA